MTDFNQSFNTNTTPPITQGKTARNDAKQANNPDKTKKTPKKEVVIYASTSQLSAVNPVIDGATTRFADYYREGNGADGTLPRTFIPKELSTKDGPASMRVYGKNAKTENKFRDLVPAYTKFIIDSVQEAHAERSQIVETFGDFYVFMFGERPPVYNFSGTLVNAKNASWVEDFMFMYESYLRGTRCVEENAVLILTYGGRQIEGLLLNVSTQTVATIEGAVPFQFSVVVFDRKTYNFSDDLGFFVSSKNGIVEDTNWTKLIAQIAGKTGKGTSAETVSKSSNIGASVMNGLPSNGTVIA